ncbi:MAG: hypothetical protein EON54_04835, partial [Alcaligenaceae bacterium]
MNGWRRMRALCDACGAEIQSGFSTGFVSDAPERHTTSTARSSFSFDSNTQIMTELSLRDLYLQHQGKVSDKWSLYLDSYNELFSAYRAERIRLLEIGVQNGGSLEIWAKYFSHAELLVGVDIDEACRALKYDDPRIKLLIGDANTVATQREIIGHSAEFDILLDDGSHTSRDIVVSFARYFPYLKDGGLYVAEDLHCSYWEAFNGGLFHPSSSISFFKRLADVLNFEHWGIPGQREAVLRTFAEEYGYSLDGLQLERIYSVEFRNSLCIIRKRPAEEVSLGPRVVAGTEAMVNEASAALNGLSMSEAYRAEEAGNEWSDLQRLPEAELATLRIDHSALQTAHARQSAAHSTLQARLLAQQREHSRQSAARSILQAELQALQEEHSRQSAARSILQAELQALQEEHSRQSEAHEYRLKLLESDLVALQERRTQLEDSLRQAEEAQMALHASRSWQVVLTLRDCAERFPRLSRFAWQFAKAVDRPSSTRLPPAVPFVPQTPSRDLPLFWRMKALFRHKRVLARILSHPFRNQAEGDFDATWYLEAYPDVQQAGTPPLRHFLRFGIFEGRAPNAYARQFDRTWYLKTYPDVAGYGDPLQHFLRHGSGEGRFPNAALQGFDAHWY